MKSEWTWNNTYLKLCERAKSPIKTDASIAFNNEKEQLYLQKDTLGVTLRASPESMGLSAVPKE